MIYVLLIFLAFIFILALLFFLVLLFNALKVKKPINILITPTDKDFVKDSDRYAESLSKMIQCKTISGKKYYNKSEFEKFYQLLQERFPNIKQKCEWTKLGNGILIKWKGAVDSNPLILMAHYDVVPDTGNWKKEPFGGEIDFDVIHGRGAVDTKGSLCAILESVEGLILEEIEPKTDVYIFSSSTEEIAGEDAPNAVKYFVENRITPGLVLDEGGAIMDNPMAGVDGRFAMIAMCERAGANLNVSIDSKNEQKFDEFLKKVKKLKLDKQLLSAEVKAMFDGLTPYMSFAMKLLFANINLTGGLLKKVLPKVSKEAEAMVSPTLNLTQPFVSNNKISCDIKIACTYYHNLKLCIEQVRCLANSMGINCEVKEMRETCKPEPINSNGYRFVADTVKRVFYDVQPSPFILFGGTDARHFVSISKSVLRFAPLYLTKWEFKSFHNANEQIHLDSIANAVKFYRELILNYEGNL